MTYVANPQVCDERSIGRRMSYKTAWRVPSLHCAVHNKRPANEHWCARSVRNNMTDGLSPYWKRLMTRAFTDRLLTNPLVMRQAQWHFFSTISWNHRLLYAAGVTDINKVTCTLLRHCKGTHILMGQVTKITTAHRDSWGRTEPHKNTDDARSQRLWRWTVRSANKCILMSERRKWKQRSISIKELTQCGSSDMRTITWGWPSMAETHMAAEF
jgi:hypothetical protein